MVRLPSAWKRHCDSLKRSCKRGLPDSGRLCRWSSTCPSPRVSFQCTVSLCNCLTALQHRQRAPPGTLQVTGVLGLALFLAGFFHIRGSGESDAPPPRRPGPPTLQGLYLNSLLQSLWPRACMDVCVMSAPTRSGRGMLPSGRSKPRLPSSAEGNEGASTSQDPSWAPQASKADAQATTSASAQQQQVRSHKVSAESPLGCCNAVTGCSRVQVRTKPARWCLQGRRSGPALPTLVASQLTGVKRVTISAPGVLLEERESSQLQVQLLGQLVASPV